MFLHAKLRVSNLQSLSKLNEAIWQDVPLGALRLPRLTSTMRFGLRGLAVQVGDGSQRQDGRVGSDSDPFWHFHRLRLSYFSVEDGERWDEAG